MSDALGNEHAISICPSSKSNCLLQNRPNCEEEHCAEHFTIIIFPFLALLIGVIATPISKAVKVPYTLFLLIVGILFGLLGCGVELGLLSTSLRQWVHINPPTVFFFVFLAPLIFEASFNTRWHVFKRLLLPILTAAFIIVGLQVALIAVFQKTVVQTEGWTYWAALMFGSMLSATDPISVTATLKSLGASELLNTLIEGESLVNDGSAFVLFEEFIKNVEDDKSASVGDIIASIFRLSLGGMVMGVGFGLVALIILGLVYDEFEVETSLTVIVAFLGFWTAQSPSKLSGVICNVASGLIISAFGRHLITPAVREPLQEFWELLSWIANTIVFVHAGVLLSAFTWSCAGEPNETMDYIYIPIYYLFLQVIRIGLILIFRPFMAIGNEWFQWREALVVGFSGLRGAVSLILALEVAGTEGISEKVQSRVVIWTTGIVALSLLVNGFLIKPLIHRLKLDKAEKTREDFLHRARAIMVQRTLMILDTLCIETGFKSARWSYVAKNVLPGEWLENTQENAEGYREAVDRLLENAPASQRKSLELVKEEERQKILYSQVNRRLSQDVISRHTSPTMTPRISQFELHGKAYQTPRSPFALLTPRASPGGDKFSAPPEFEFIGSPAVTPLSLGMSARPGQPSLVGAHRRSIDADFLRYSQSRPEKPTQSKIHDEVQALHMRMMAGQQYELTDEDREVRRRLLTAILSHVRAISNASLVEYNVLVNLEEDVQMALDANEEKKEYDLFSFLSNKDRKNQWLYKAYLKVVEGKRLSGESSITNAVIVFGILTTILKEEILHDSPIIQLQAEQLYEGAAALLNRLETLNPEAFEWVESQFAVYVTANKQDGVLEDLLASGVVDEQEFKIVHEELIEVRRSHVRARQSIFQRSTLPVRPKPRALLRAHPLFCSLSRELLSDVVDRYGELVHLKGGQALQSERGSLVLVLEGAIRPLEDSVLPLNIASGIRNANTEVDMAVTLGSPPSPRMVLSHAEQTVTATNDGKSEKGFTPLASGATMHWCFPALNGFCGAVVTLQAHNTKTGKHCSIAHERTVDTQFCCCEIAGSATVFTLPVNQVKRLAQESPEFRLEITRSLAREIVLESVADQRPYTLSHFMESITTPIDVNTVVGRASRVLERLPYMIVVPLHAGEQCSMHMQGPGVLLNGTVRVSIVDTSGLIGAINLLHEELTGPALLPAGGLILEEVHDPNNPDQLQRQFRSNLEIRHIQSEIAIDASSAAAEILEVSENQYDGRDAIHSHKSSEILAHVLIEEVTEADKTALLRLQRWGRLDTAVDMNGRFGMNRHVELTPLLDTKVE